LDAARETLQTQISRLLGWERRKRREATLTVALFYAFLGALGAPLFVSISQGWAWSAPVAIFALLAPCLFFTRRWRDQDTARALAALDKALRLDERATTAWELMRRNETKAVALLVLREASDKLKSLDARALFPRSWGWHGYLLAPLLALWLALHIFDTRFQPQGAGPGHPPSLSQELREFARRLQEKAQSEGLPRALEAGRELEKIAQRGIDAGTADEQFKSELAGTGKKMAAERNAAGPTPFGVAESRQQLEDLRAELEAARELLDATDGEGRSLQDRLAGLRQLKQQLERQERGAQMLSRDEMKAFLNKLERRVAGELDRRALLEAEQFLQQLAQGGQGKPGDAQARAGANKERDAAGDGRRKKNDGAAPGEGPARNSGEAPSPPEFQAGARARVKGMIGEGERSSIFFKGKPAPGKSGLSQDEVLASYRRQAEAELNTERIPGELKDTIRNYFLSLEKAK
jgi:hypothetical protein